MNILQQEVAKYLLERGWGVSPPGEFAKSVSIEAGELLENFQWSNPTAEELKQDPARVEQVSHEMADVVIYAIELCHVLDIDFEKAVLAKLSIAKEKYPAELVKNDPDKVGQIHRQHRQNNV